MSDRPAPRRRARTVLGAVGVAFLGAIGGVLAAIIVQDLLAPFLVAAPGRPSMLGMILGLLLPLSVPAGAGLALVLHHRRQRSGS